MKVLFITSWYPNSTNPLKGIFIKKHAEAIKKGGVDIEVLAITVNNSSKFYEKKISRVVDENGITTHSIELNSRFYKWIHLNLWWQSEIIKRYFLKHVKPEFQADTIHSNVLYPAAILGDGIAKLEKLPHLITEHWSGVDKFMKKSLYSGFGKKAYNRAKCITVVSGFLKNNLSKQVNDPEKIKVVPNVVDTSIFSFKAKSENTKLTFCCVAHWNGVKRPDLIFDSLERFSKQSTKPIVLNVIGVGILLDELKSRKWNFKINYLGNLVRQHLAEQLQYSDYFLHASTTETFSIVIAEALATGTPVLASNAGAIPELINTENGLLCDNDVESWSDGLHKLVQMKFDNVIISEQAKKFSLEKIGNRFVELYKSIL